VADTGITAYRDIRDPAALARGGLFVAEGRLVVRRLLASTRFKTRSVLVTPIACDAIRDVIPDAVPCYIVDQSEMDSIVGFNIHRGCLALAERPAIPVITLLDLETASRVVVLEGVNNPDNIGGIFRSAAAFDVQLVVLGPGCGDPFYRKAVRTSMAATLDVPMARADVWPAAIDRLRACGLRVVALTPAADATRLDERTRVGERLALLVGAEEQGLSVAALAAADERVRIRMTNRVDSLNVTVAASIAMYYCFG
jgi:tRNA G18 (ribose-2'-O)-methylase SpoU